MSFGFQFDDSEMDEEYLSSSNGPIQPSASTSTSAPEASTADQAPFRDHSLQDMLEHLPSRISYSSIDVSLPSGSGEARVQKLLRRDLFDARFQMLLDEDDEQEESASQSNGAQQAGNVDAESDLIPGVYEGGLKTWECALDLVETLDALNTTDPSPSDWHARLAGKHILELGCGTALPVLFLLSQVLQTPSQSLDLTLHLADYNAQVLQLVTLPNLVLTWYASPASLDYRTTTESSQLTQEQHELSRRGQEHFTTDDNELAISDSLVAAFVASLSSRGITLRFYSGAWSTFPSSLPGLGGERVDMILTSETIYSLESLPALVDLLHRYARKQSTVLVAAKVIYFGVGGGVESFKQALLQTCPHASVQPVHTVTKGVGRTVLSVSF